MNTHLFTLKSPIDQDVYVSFHTWPTRSYPDSCSVGNGANNHQVIIRGLLDDNGLETVWSFSEWITYAPFRMTANEGMTVELTFDWSSMPDSSRDFSIVVWRTDRLPVSIEPETPLTAISFPLTWRPDYDVSDQSEPEAESCQGNPADAAFASWYGVESFPITTPDEGFCGWNTNSLTTTSGSNVDVYFIIRAACNVPWRAMSYVVTLT